MPQQRAFKAWRYLIWLWLLSVQSLWTIKSDFAPKVGEQTVSQLSTKANARVQQHWRNLVYHFGLNRCMQQKLRSPKKPLLTKLRKRMLRRMVYRILKMKNYPCRQQQCQVCRQLSAAIKTELPDFARRLTKKAGSSWLKKQRDRVLAGLGLGTLTVGALWAIGALDWLKNMLYAALAAGYIAVSAELLRLLKPKGPALPTFPAEGSAEPLTRCNACVVGGFVQQQANLQARQEEMQQQASALEETWQQQHSPQLLQEVHKIDDSLQQQEVELRALKAELTGIEQQLADWQGKIVMALSKKIVLQDETLMALRREFILLRAQLQAQLLTRDLDVAELQKLALANQQLRTALALRPSMVQPSIVQTGVSPELARQHRRYIDETQKLFEAYLTALGELHLLYLVAAWQGPLLRPTAPVVAPPIPVGASPRELSVPTAGMSPGYMLAAVTANIGAGTGFGPFSLMGAF